LRGQVGNVGEGIAAVKAGGLGDLGSLLGLGGEQGAIQTTNMANQIGDGLNAALPNAIIERGVGANTLKGIGDDMDADEEGKKKLAGVVTNGMLQYMADEVDGVGQQMIAFLTESVARRLGVATGEVRP